MSDNANSHREAEKKTTVETLHRIKSTFQFRESFVSRFRKSAREKKNNANSPPKKYMVLNSRGKFVWTLFGFAIFIYLFRTCFLGMLGLLILYFRYVRSFSPHYFYVYRHIRHAEYITRLALVWSVHVHCTCLEICTLNIRRTPSKPKSCRTVRSFKSCNIAKRSYKLRFAFIEFFEFHGR